ncbi:hypothetical protein BPAE_0911g00040 [Botrytis paeoniae]|uniref:Uncharacterized protein n=1 Tax=Botrytis paeoniae TaxID=278948 RepID=A0A4Z1EJH4_9HELO|nr:hypothetical protein BPAE_0911g00040 [Botrytis paeoniae]
MDTMDTVTGASKAALKDDIESLLDAIFEGIEATTALVAKAFDSLKDRALVYIDDDTLEDSVAAMFDETRDTAITLAKVLLERARDMAVVFVLDALRLDN